MAVDDFVSDYLAGSSIDSPAAQLGVHRRTILSHLDGRGIHRRSSIRKMTVRSVREATKHDEAGESLTAVGVRFDVDAKILAREFRRDGIETRSRRGWPTGA